MRPCLGHRQLQHGDGDGAAAPVAPGGSAQACRGPLTHERAYSPLMFPSVQLDYFFLTRHQPHCIQPAQKVKHLTTAGCGGYQRSKLLQPRSALCNPLASLFPCCSAKKLDEIIRSLL